MVKKLKVMKLLNLVLGLVVQVAIGGLFFSGVTLSNPLLGFLGATVHTIVGWAIVVLAVVDLVRKVM